MTDLDRTPIEDHGVIGDLRSAALVTRTAAIDWLCWPRFDSPPLFGALLGRAGGACEIEGDWQPAGRAYRTGTAILDTHLAAGPATITVTDFMPLTAIADPGNTGPDADAPGTLIRIVTCTAGPAEVTIRVAPRFDWGETQVAAEPDGTAIRWPDRPIVVTASHPITANGPDARVAATLQTGETLVLILAHDAPADPATATAALDATAAYWTGWSAACRYDRDHSELVLRSAITMKLLTHAPTGGLIAAVTTSLPEAVGHARNWDYRYVWTRDAVFCVSAFLVLGYRREAAEFLRFLHHRDGIGADGPLRVMYALDGDVPDEISHPALTGWCNSAPVRSGNGANDQAQHEIYGEYLAALNLYTIDHGTDGLCRELVGNLENFVRRCARAAIDRFDVPDQGIWELRGPARHLLHSKAMCWAAVDRARLIFDRLGFAPDPDWQPRADAMLAELHDRTWDADVASYVMEYGGTDLDMSTLRLALMAVFDPASDRFARTIAAHEAALGRGGLHDRYRFDDGLAGREGAFVAASFRMVGAHAAAGDTTAAARKLAPVLAAASDLGLYGEEIDPDTGAHLGNFPQGLSHMALIHEVMRLYGTNPAH
ncbi:glycoside hydrolase family 15 protein [Sphingomonas arantia]|uniref:Glycoside hydrolase family 15 protein n=1 Tax=Sphingomonas arantia TaxID=1460676 RepID=A0ABW4TVC7_9SPHN